MEENRKPELSEGRMSLFREKEKPQREREGEKEGSTWLKRGSAAEKRSPIDQLMLGNQRHAHPRKSRKQREARDHRRVLEHSQSARQRPRRGEVNGNGEKFCKKMKKKTSGGDCKEASA